MESMQQFRQQETDLEYGREQIEKIAPVPDDLADPGLRKEWTELNEAQRVALSSRDFNHEQRQEALAKIRERRRRLEESIEPPPSMEDQFAKDTLVDESGARWQKQQDEWKQIAPPPEDPQAKAAKDAAEKREQYNKAVTGRADKYANLMVEDKPKYATYADALKAAMADEDAARVLLGGGETGVQETVVRPDGLIAVPPERAASRPGEAAPPEADTPVPWGPGGGLSPAEDWRRPYHPGPPATETITGLPPAAPSPLPDEVPPARRFEEGGAGVPSLSESVPDIRRTAEPRKTGAPVTPPEGKVADSNLAKGLVYVPVLDSKGKDTGRRVWKPGPSNLATSFDGQQESEKEPSARDVENAQKRREHRARRQAELQRRRRRRLAKAASGASRKYG
jgi:hypothetical protein